MPIPVTCSGCDKRYQVKDEFAGKRVRCPQCQALVTIGPPEAVGAKNPTASRKSDDFEDYDADEETDSLARQAPKVRLQPAKKRKLQKSILYRISPIWMLIPLLVILTTVTVLSLFYFPPVAWILACFVIFGAGMMMFVSAMKCREMSFGDDDLATRIMFALFSPFIFIYIFARWSDLMPYSMTFTIGGLILLSGIGLERAAYYRAKHLYHQSFVAKAQKEHDEHVKDHTKAVKEFNKPQPLPPALPRQAGPDTRPRLQLPEFQVTNYTTGHVFSTNQLKVGDRVFVEEGGWHDAEILGVDPDGAKVHFVGWEDNWDHKVPLSKIQPRKP